MSTYPRLEGTDAGELHKLIKVWVREGRTQEAFELAERAHERYPKHRRLADTLVGLRQHYGQSDAALELAIRNAWRRRDRLASRRDQRRPERALAPEERIFLSGYFYSGSGAVVDYLADHDGIETWTPAGEMRLIKFPGGMDDVARRQAEHGQLQVYDLVDLYLHLSGHKVVTTPKGTYSRWGMVNRNSRRLHKAATARGYLVRCYEHYVALVERAKRGPLSGDELEVRFRSWVTDALDAAAADTGADRLVIDQAVTAWKLGITRFVPPSTFVVVHRDPRDQFVEAREVLQRPGRSSATPFRFAASYLRRRRAVRSMIPRLERDHGHRFLTLGFEPFVVRHEETSAWLDQQLGLDGRPRTGRSFDPEVSRMNVAKHRGSLSFRDRSVLSILLFRYLSSEAGG